MPSSRCQAITTRGNPCSATTRPGRPLCLWHDDSPQAEEARRELSRRGGAARSNSARARKGLVNAALTPSELEGFVGLALRSVLDGQISPGVANAVAALARAAVVVREATELETRLVELEAAAGIAGGSGRMTR